MSKTATPTPQCRTIASLSSLIGDSCRHAAASYHHLELLEYLISAGGDINLRDEDGDTPLYTVESVDMARWLIEHGADPAAQNEEGLTVSRTGASGWERELTTTRSRPKRWRTTNLKWPSTSARSPPPVPQHL